MKSSRPENKSSNDNLLKKKQMDGKTKITFTCCSAKALETSARDEIKAVKKTKPTVAKDEAPRESRDRRRFLQPARAFHFTHETGKLCFRFVCLFDKSCANRDSIKISYGSFCPWLTHLTFNHACPFKHSPKLLKSSLLNAPRRFPTN